MRKTKVQSGILLIDKPEGPSSAHIVHRVKALLRVNKVGHLGTLDPFASGLLLLGVEDGTKIADLFLSAPKRYRGVMELGVATDSQDCTGKIVEIRDVPPIGEKELQALERAFTGSLQQTPPMFSALKKNGVRLYRLARQGKEVERDPRSITIDQLKLQWLAPRDVQFEVACSRGTYVRTLAADMGQFLGCGAHLKSLRRLACGHFTVEQSVPFGELEKLHAENAIPFISFNQATAHLRQVPLDSHLLSRLKLGQQHALAYLDRPQTSEKMVRIVDARKNLVALAEWVEDIPGGRWRLFRVFKT